MAGRGGAKKRKGGGKRSAASAPPEKRTAGRPRELAAPRLLTVRIPGDERDFVDELAEKFAGGNVSVVVRRLIARARQDPSLAKPR